MAPVAWSWSPIFHLTWFAMLLFEESVAVAEKVTLCPSVMTVAVAVMLKEGIDPLTADTAAEAFTLPSESETFSNRESQVEVSIKILLIGDYDHNDQE